VGNSTICEKAIRDPGYKVKHGDEYKKVKHGDEENENKNKHRGGCIIKIKTKA